MSQPLPDLQGSGPLHGGSLADLLSGGPPPATNSDDGGAKQTDPLTAIQDSIDNVHQLMVSLTDPTDVHDATTALRLLTGIQKRLMGNGAPQATPGG